MSSSTSIIAGIDYSPSSSSVLRQAAHLSKQTGAKVTALNVVDGSAVASWKASQGSRSDAASVESRAMAKLEDWIKAENEEATAEIRVGRPADELHGCVVEHKASILVIAANDTTKKRLGTIASRCVRVAPCDVMVLRGWQGGDFRKIVVCADFSDASSLALERAVGLASAQGAALEIVHVMYPPGQDLWGEVLDHKEEAPTSYADECREEVAKQMEQFLAPHAGALAGIEHQTVVLESTVPSVSLTHHVIDCGADLVVMGTRGHSKFASYFLGTNAERLMQDATVSVLAIRP